MEWYNIIVLIVGAFGGISGIVALYKAKPERDGIEVSNFNAMLTSLMNRCDKLENQITEDRAQSHKYVMELRNGMQKQEDEITELRGSVQKLERTVTQAYRCRYPDDIRDCPVIKEYERAHCEDCGSCERAEGHA